MDHSITYSKKFMINYGLVRNWAIIAAVTNYYTYDVGSFRITSHGYPDWKERIARGLMAGTTMTAGRRTIESSIRGFCSDHSGAFNPANYDYRYGPAQLEGSAVLGSWNTSFDLGLQSKARDEGRINLVKSYRKIHSQFQGGVFLGELAEAIRFLKSPARRLEKMSIGAADDLYRDLKRLGRGGGIDGKSSRALRVATDAHLAYTYAAKPLVKDIIAADNALRAYYEQRPFKIFRIRGDGAAKSRTHSWTFVNSYTNPGATFSIGASRGSYTVDRITDLTVRYIGAYKSQNSSGLPTPMEQLSLTPDNWGATIYELFPWSFVMDYFSNLGGLVDAFSFQFIGLEWLIETTRQLNTVDVSGISHRTPEAGFNYETSVDHSYGSRILDKQFLVKRQEVNNQYIPSLRLKIPGLGQDLNMAALANSLLKFKH